MSVTILGLVVAVLSKVVQVSGVNISNADLTAFLTTGGQLIGAGLIYWGRVRQGDITWYGARKDVPAV